MHFATYVNIFLHLLLCLAGVDTSWKFGMADGGENRNGFDCG